MVKRSALEQFKGRINPAQAAEGIKCAVQNAQDLLAEAELLLENEHWARACALAILAIEEVGKPPILRAILLARNDEELRDEWRAYRSHTKKNVTWILPQLVAEGARRLEDLRAIFDEQSDHASLLDAVKQIAFYTDACGNCHWSKPSEVIDQKLAETIVWIARMLVGGQSSAMSTEPELELWVKHMRPVWKQSMEQMKMALLACYADAEERGILSGKHTAKEMSEFIDL
jgi:AbiV family abortive infection protein